MTFIRKLKIGDKTYLAEVRSYRKDGKVKQEFVRYVGKLTNDHKVIPGKFQRLRIDRVTVIGGTLVLKSIAGELDIQDVLDVHTNENGALLLALAIMHCLNPASLNSAKKHFFKFGIDVAFGVNIEKANAQKLSSAMDYLEENTSFALQKKLFEKLCAAYGSPRDSLFYDITNVYLYGVKCGLARRGYSSKRIHLPQIEIGLAVDRRGFPIFHRVFDGNVHASKTLQAVMNDLRALGIKNVTLVLDRGMAVEGLISSGLKTGFDVIVGLPLRGKLKRLAVKLSREMVSPKNVVKLTNVFVHAKEMDWEGGKLLICLNEKERVLIKEGRYRRIYRSLESGKVDNVTKYLRKTKKGYEIDGEALKREEETDGLYAIFTNRGELTKEEILKAYFEKDLVEKSFRALKGVLGIAPVRHWLEHRVRAHVFICYLAYLLASVMQHKLRPLGVSILEALGEMESVYRVTIRDPLKKAEFTKFSTFTKRQEEIVKAVNPKLLRSMV